MKKIFLLALSIVAASVAKSQTSIITANILRQTYLIRTETQQGTCFLIEINNQEYLLTAKHLFRPNIHSGDSTRIIIFQENKPLNLNVQFYIHTDSTVDIAVLKLKDSIKVMSPFPIGGDVVLGQDIFFLGFPSFNKIQFSTSGTIGILPLVKKGIISGWFLNNTYTLFFLDGHNNPGFSGGPAIGIDNTTRKATIFGVISGYYYETKPVKNILEQDELTHVQENSGIIKCYPTEVVKQIVSAIR